VDDGEMDSIAYPKEQVSRQTWGKSESDVLLRTEHIDTTYNKTICFLQRSSWQSLFDPSPVLSTIFPSDVTHAYCKIRGEILSRKQREKG
jgi:hypothetical protein